MKKFALLDEKGNIQMFYDCVANEVLEYNFPGVLYAEIPNNDLGKLPENPVFYNGAWISKSELPPTYKTITKLQAIDMILKYAEMDDAKHLAFRKDPNLELFWLRWREDVPNDGIRRDSPLTGQTVGAIVATGHMTKKQADTLMAAWPTIEP